MTDRDRVYIGILSFGIQRMRDAALLGLVEYCAVEAEHLHNVPSLIGESNERRHEYYFQQERTHYLKRLDKSVPGINITLRCFEELWQQLSKLNIQTRETACSYCADPVHAVLDELAADQGSATFLCQCPDCGRYWGGHGYTPQYRWELSPDDAAKLFPQAFVTADPPQPS